MFRVKTSEARFYFTSADSTQNYSAVRQHADSRQRRDAHCVNPATAFSDKGSKVSAPSRARLALPGL